MNGNRCELCAQENPGLRWTIGGTSVTIYSLCCAIQQLKSHSSNFSWAAVSRALGLSKSATSASSLLKRKYERYIQPYESRSMPAAAGTPANNVISYLEQRFMANKLSDKLTTVTDILSARNRVETPYLQFLRNQHHLPLKKPDDRIANSVDPSHHILEFYNESQPFTNESLADLLERLDGVVSLTVGPLTYLTAAPDLQILHQSLQRLILYDLPSHLVEEVYEMAAEGLPKLHTLSILATSFYTTAPPHNGSPITNARTSPCMVETAIW